MKRVSQRLCGKFLRRRQAQTLQPSSQYPMRSGLIHLQKLFQLQVGVSEHEAIDKHLLDVFKNEVSDEVHRFLLTHRVNGRPEVVQRTNTHDDVHDGMVIHIGPPVDEHYCGQVTCHFPHLPHVLVVDQMVEIWDELRGRKTNRHNRFDPLYVHLLSFYDRLEWTCDLIVRQSSPFPKLFSFSLP